MKSQIDIKIKEYLDMIRGTRNLMSKTHLRGTIANSLKIKIKKYQDILNRLNTLKKQGMDFPPSEYDY